MNEKIKALYKQSYEPGTAIDPRNEMPYNTVYFSNDKFAELIVRQCAEVGLDSVEDGDNLDAIMKRVHNNILKHFGVK